MRLPRSRPREPWLVLGPLLVVQGLALLFFALHAQHNGWLFQQPQDATRYYTTSWLLSGWHMPTTPIGYGWPYLVAPISLLAGPNLLAALPVLVIVQALVLPPVALLCVYGIASRIGGRLVGYWTGAAFVLVPYALIPLWDHRYRQIYESGFLPGPLGLTALPELPTTVLLLLGAYLVIRALDERTWSVAALAGIAAGFAVAVKPSAGIFLAGPFAALALARLWRPLAGFALAVLPTLIVLGIWKHRGAGGTPPIALGASASLPPTASFFDSITRYVDLDVRWSQLGHNLDLLREYFGSIRFLEWLPIAGAIGIARRSVPKAALVALWFAAFFFIKGAAPDAQVPDASFLRALEPAFPAYLLLVGAIPLLVPTLGTRLVERFPAAALRSLPWRPLLATGGVVAVLLPLILVLAVPRTNAPLAAGLQSSYVPVDEGFRLTAAQSRLQWPSRAASSAAVGYAIYRAPMGTDVYCAPECTLPFTQIGATGEATFAVPPGKFVYRVALLASPLGPLLLSTPATP